MKAMLAALAVLAAAAALGAGAIVALGAYDVAATDQHFAPTYRLIDIAMRRSVARRAAHVTVPPLRSEAKQARGLALYDRHCVTCHGAPGVAPAPFALGLTPTPANLAHTAREWSPAALYRVVRHGIKMTGMPAWEHRLRDDELWAIVAFLALLPTLKPDDYRERTGRVVPPPAVAHELPDEATPAGSATRGRRAIQQYACASCHRIPGIVGANAPVGPPLDGIARRGLIAGVLPNTPANLVRWLRAPQAIAPDAAMPDLGLTAQHAADIAAYLGTLD